QPLAADRDLVFRRGQRAGEREQRRGGERRASQSRATNGRHGHQLLPRAVSCGGRTIAAPGARGHESIGAVAGRQRTSIDSCALAPDRHAWEHFAMRVGLKTLLAAGALVWVAGTACADERDTFLAGAAMSCNGCDLAGADLKGRELKRARL